MGKQVADAKKNLREMRADIENDPEISEEERVALRSVLQAEEKKPSILRRLFRKILR